MKDNETTAWLIEMKDYVHQVPAWWGGSRYGWRHDRDAAQRLDRAVMANEWFDNPMTREMRARFRDEFEIEYMVYRQEIEERRAAFEATQRRRPLRRLLTALRLARFFPIKHKPEFMVPDRRFW